MASAMASSSARFSPCESSPARSLRAIGNAGLFERGHRRRVERASSAARPKKRKLEPVARLHRERDVFQHRKSRQDRRDLKAARSPRKRAQFRRRRGHVGAGEQAIAVVGRRSARIFD
jgi:hypothetical protein